MTRRTKLWVSWAVFLGVVILWEAAWKASQGKVSAEAVARARAGVAREFINQPAQDFESVALDGRRIRLSELRGKVVLLNFWATWCGPCREEMPELVRLYQNYHASGLEILAISVDANKDAVPPFVRQFQLPFPVIVSHEIRKLYGDGGIPETLFIGREGAVRFRARGYSPAARAKHEAVVQELLAAPKSNPPRVGQLVR